MEITIEEFSSIVDKSNLKRTTSSSTESFIQECSKVFSVFDFDEEEEEIEERRGRGRADPRIQRGPDNRARPLEEEEELQEIYPRNEFGNYEYNDEAAKT